MCDVKGDNGKYQNRAVLILFFNGVREVLTEKLGIESRGLHLNFIFYFLRHSYVLNCCTVVKTIQRVLIRRVKDGAQERNPIHNEIYYLL